MSTIKTIDFPYFSHFIRLNIRNRLLDWDRLNFFYCLLRISGWIRPMILYSLLIRNISPSRIRNLSFDFFHILVVNFRWGYDIYGTTSDLSSFIYLASTRNIGGRARINYLYIIWGEFNSADERGGIHCWNSYDLISLPCGYIIFCRLTNNLFNNFWWLNSSLNGLFPFYNNWYYWPNYYLWFDSDGKLANRIKGIFYFFLFDVFTNFFYFNSKFFKFSLNVEIF